MGILGEAGVGRVGDEVTAVAVTEDKLGKVKASAYYGTKLGPRQRWFGQIRIEVNAGERLTSAKMMVQLSHQMHLTMHARTMTRSPTNTQDKVSMTMVITYRACI